MERIPQALLDERLAGTRFEFSRHAPAAPLCPFVQYYWIVRWDLRGGAPHTQRVLPNLSVHLSFGHDAAGIWGPRQEVFSYRLAGRDQALGVRFRPGRFRSFLGRPVAEIADAVLPLEELFGPQGTETGAAVRRATSTADTVALTDRLLCANLPTASASEEACGRGRRADRGRSHDHPRRASERGDGSVGAHPAAPFSDCVGVRPKWAIRVYRLNDAAKRISTDPGLDYARLAAELGYSDQAHFTRDFAAVTGIPPAAYGRRQA